MRRIFPVVGFGARRRTFDLGDDLQPAEDLQVGLEAILAGLRDATEVLGPLHRSMRDHVAWSGPLWKGG